MDPPPTQDRRDARRIWPERHANHCPASRQRPPCPPDVQCGNVAVPDGLLPPRVRRDPADGQIDLDEALRIVHGPASAARGLSSPVTVRATGISTMGNPLRESLKQDS